jgi:hypothetical protein
MSWGTVETEPEVAAWLDSLSETEFGTVEYHIDLLAERGVLLGEPDTRQLGGKLRELRFYLGREQTRITYFIAPGRRIILLTVFRKTRWRERAEVRRALAAMDRCTSEGHTAEDG